MAAANCGIITFRSVSQKNILPPYPGVGYDKLSKLGVDGGGFHLVVFVFAPSQKIKKQKQKQKQKQNKTKQNETKQTKQNSRTKYCCNVLETYVCYKSHFFT